MCRCGAMAAFVTFWFEVELASGGGEAVASPVQLAVPGQPAAPGQLVAPCALWLPVAPRHIDTLDAAIGSCPLRGNVPQRQDWVHSWADSSSGQIWWPPASGNQQFWADWQSWWPSSSGGQPAVTGENQVASQPAAPGEVSWLPRSSWLPSRRPPYANVKVVGQTNEGDRVRRSFVNWGDVPCRNGASCANQCECPFQHDAEAHACRVVPLHMNEVARAAADRGQACPVHLSSSL